MELEKRLKSRGITYEEYLESVYAAFYTVHEQSGYSYEVVEDYEVEDEGEDFCNYVVDRMLCFLAMAYYEIIGKGLTDRLQYELELDMPIWNSGALDKFLDDENKKLAYDHLQIVKDYIKKHSK